MKSTSSHRILGVLIAGLLAAVAIAGTGCRGRAARLEARRLDRYTRNLVREASRDTGCPEGALTPQQIADGPAVFTVTGCTTPIEYWLECRGRGNRNCRWHNVPLLNQSAAMPLQCPPQAIMQQPTQAPNARYAVGCGRVAPFTIACNGAACGWAQSGPVAMQGGPAMAQPGPVGPQPQVAQPQPPPPQSPDAVIQQQVQMQREAILSCVDDTQLTLRLRWTAEGQVILQLPPNLAGTAAEGCINAVVGALRVAASAPGEVTVPVQ